MVMIVRGGVQAMHHAVRNTAGANNPVLRGALD